MAIANRRDLNYPLYDYLLHCAPAHTTRILGPVRLISDATPTRDGFQCSIEHFFEK